MGPELVWKAVLQWPALLLGCVLAARAVSRRRFVPAWLVPFLAVLVPGCVAVAAQEAIAPGEVFAHFPAGVSYGALPRALAVACAVATATGTGFGRLGALASSLAVPATAMVLISPPGLGGGVAQLAALAVACAGARAAATASGRRGAVPFASWWLVFAVASVAVLLSGFAKLALVLGAFSAAAAALGVAARLAAAPAMTNGTASCLATAYVACVFLGCGYDESDFPRSAWALLAAAPVAMACARVPAIASRPRLAAAVLVAAPGAVAGLALARALLAPHP